MVYQSPTPLRAITGISASNVWAAGDASAVVHWDGTAWTAGTVPAPSNTVLWSISAGGGSIQAAGQFGRIYTYNGTWTSAQAGTLDLHAIWGNYAGGDDPNSIFADSMGTWSALPAAGAQLLGAWGNSAAVLMVGASQRITRIIARAVTNDTVTGPATTFRGIFGLSENQAWAVGTSGVVASSNGTQWSEVTAAPGAELDAIWGTGTTNLWAVGDLGAIYHYDGSSWSSVPSGNVQGYNLNGIWGADAQTIWASAELNGMTGAIFQY
jgi:hypothetical protein